MTGLEALKYVEGRDERSGLIQAAEIKIGEGLTADIETAMKYIEMTFDRSARVERVELGLELERKISLSAHGGRLSACVCRYEFFEKHRMRWLIIQAFIVHRDVPCQAAR